MGNNVLFYSLLAFTYENIILRRRSFLRQQWLHLRNSEVTEDPQSRDQYWAFIQAVQNIYTNKNKFRIIFS